LKPERFPSGRAACVAIVAAATMVITATTDLAQRRDQSRRELGTLLAASIADPEAAWYEPDSLLSARIRQWMPLIRRYPQSDLAWGVSDASIEIGGAVDRDSTSNGFVRLLAWGDVDALGLDRRRTVVTAVEAKSELGDRPLFWCAARADSGTGRWEGEAAVQELFEGRIPEHVALACTSWVVAPSEYAPLGLHEGAVPEAVRRAIDAGAERVHHRLIDPIPDIETVRHLAEMSPS
jgi:hypothetical protein